MSAVHQHPRDSGRFRGRLRALFVERTDRASLQIARSVLSSNLGFAVDFGVLAFLVEVAHLHYLVSASVGFAIGTTITYLLSIYWVFRIRRMEDRRAEYGIYFGIGVVGVGLNAALMWTFTDLLAVYYLLSKIISATVVFFFNFLARRRLLFR